MSGEVVLGEDRFRRRADGDWEMLTPTPDVTITFGSTEATERRWRQLAQALDDLAAERAEVERLSTLYGERIMELHALTADLAAERAALSAADALANLLRALGAEQHDEIERLRSEVESLTCRSESWRADAVGDVHTCHVCEARRER